MVNYANHALLTVIKVIKATVNDTQLDITEKDKGEADIFNFFDINSQERTIVDLIKTNMIHERTRDEELIMILKEHRFSQKRAITKKCNYRQHP